MEEYVDRGLVTILTDGLLTADTLENFRGTFDIILNAAGPDGLKRFGEGAFRGRVGLIALETVAVGVSANLDAIRKSANPNRLVLERIRELWSHPQIAEFGRAGLRGTQQIQRTLPFGVEWFRP